MGSPIKGRVNEEKGRPQDLQFKIDKREFIECGIGNGECGTETNLKSGKGEGIKAFEWGSGNAASGSKGPTTTPGGKAE